MSPSTKPIAKLWESYLLILPKDATANQITETRRAFYAGAQALFHSILVNLDPDQEPTENDLRRMDDIQQELREFREMVLKGRA